jgi:hypothetical protein
MGTGGRGFSFFFLNLFITTSYGTLSVTLFNALKINTGGRSLYREYYNSKEISHTSRRPTEGAGEPFIPSSQSPQVILPQLPTALG